MGDRSQLLLEEPRNKAIDMAELTGIANAIEVEAVARYAQLAELMERRGELDTAATFREMCELEKSHIEAVGRWATSLHQEIRPPSNFTWRLPTEIGASWDEARDSSLLTPYRALAIAVINEERAFAFYAYIAANATDPEVRRQAEIMAREELAHAAELRVRRRRAWRREHPGAAMATDIRTLAAFRALERRLEDDAAAFHRGIARVLATKGDTESAALVDAMARREGDPLRGGEVALPAASTAREAPALLLSAVQPLERSSEIYEDLIAHAPTEDVLAAAQAALRGVIGRIASLSRRRGEIESGS
jgi:rubrerythrin